MFARNIIAYAYLTIFVGTNLCATGIVSAQTEPIFENAEHQSAEENHDELGENDGDEHASSIAGGTFIQKIPCDAEADAMNVSAVLGLQVHTNAEVRCMATIFPHSIYETTFVGKLSDEIVEVYKPPPIIIGFTDVRFTE